LWWPPNVVFSPKHHDSQLRTSLLARFSMPGALGRDMAGNNLKRGFKWYPAGLVVSKIASQAYLVPMCVGRFCGELPPPLSQNKGRGGREHPSTCARLPNKKEAQEKPEVPITTRAHRPLAQNLFHTTLANGIVTAPPPLSPCCAIMMNIFL
jgi:hypothetical protein